MNKGKDRCEILKNIRLQIAQENEIPFQVDPCTFDGECRGTCPRCEAELLYLEQKIAEKKQFGKKALVAGISLGLISTFSACNYNKTQGEIIQNDEEKNTITFLKDTVVRKIPSIIDFNHKPEELKSENKVYYETINNQIVTIETIELDGAVSKKPIGFTPDLDLSTVMESLERNRSNKKTNSCSTEIDLKSIVRGEKPNDTLQ